VAEERLRCQKCGEMLADGARICAACGEPVHPFANDEPVAARPPIAYAGFWLRGAAYILDSFLLGLVVGLVILVPLIRRGAIPADNPWVLFTGTSRQIVAIQLLVTMASWLYFASFESSKWQATPGKRAFGLRVTDLQGNPISFARASGRYFGKIISGTLFMIGFAIAGITPRKQALHDIIARCLVLRKT
jgi:uncharacterized RDD family membrane protein YckC